MDFLKSISVAASGLKTQAGRMRIIAENIANADSVSVNGGDPYRRKVATFKSEIDRALDMRLVNLGRARNDASAFVSRHMPGHPAADANGYVKFPNVNTIVEMADMREAQRSYEANINVIGAARRMIQRTLDILKA